MSRSRIADDRLAAAIFDRAEDGHCVAAKHIRMGVLLGTVCMLAKRSGVGVTIDISHFPIPP